MGVVETGTHRSRGEVEECRDLAGLVAHVVAEHQDRPFAGVEAPETTVELVALRDAQEFVGRWRIVERQQAEVRCHPPFPPGLGDADEVDECRLITVLCRLDEVAIHQLLPAWAPIGDAVHLYRWILRHQRWKFEPRQLQVPG
ncbi:MAG: hypothetical protein HW391_130 [Chloroflexi bacterium]|nr:hypothetical protein [Chloroflexota bacterium]